MDKKPSCISYGEVFSHYVNESRRIITPDKRVLKTDSYNEGFRDPIILAGDNAVLLEFNSTHIAKAKEVCPYLNIVEGDIRHLPFKDNSFDLIIDLSTLDHILPSETGATLSEYARVLDKGGTLLLITWLAENVYNYTDWNSDSQYYFDYESIKSQLDESFTIESEKNLFEKTETAPGKCTLYQFICKKC